LGKARASRLNCHFIISIRVTDKLLYMDPDQLVEEYQALVKSVVSKYRSEHLSREDLIQEGMIGLLEANKRFNPTRGVQFGSYAHYCITKRILSALDQHSEQTADPKTMEDIADKASTELSAPGPDLTSRLPQDMPLPERQVIILSYQKAYTIAQMAEELGISRERVKQLRAKALRRMRGVLEG